MHESLLDLLHGLVIDGNKPAKAVAEEIGKPYPTLMRELNPADEDAKLAVNLLLPIMRSTGSSAPIQYLAHRMGFRLVPYASRTPDKSTLAEECMDTYPAVTTFHASMAACLPLEVVGAAMEEAIRELEEDFVSYRNKLAGDE